EREDLVAGVVPRRLVHRQRPPGIAGRDGEELAVQPVVVRRQRRQGGALIGGQETRGGGGVLPPGPGGRRGGRPFFLWGAGGAGGGVGEAVGAVVADRPLARQRHGVGGPVPGEQVLAVLGQQVHPLERLAVAEAWRQRRQGAGRGPVRQGSRGQDQHVGG